MLRLYRPGSLLDAVASDGQGLLESVHRAAFGVRWMVHSYDFDLLFVVPFALGVAFMVWVFWNLAKQIKR